MTASLPPPTGSPSPGPSPFGAAPSGAAPTLPRVPWVTGREVRAGLLVAGVLVVVGVLAGLAWLWWSPPRGIALALGPHTLLPDETEAFVAADGRFAVLTGAVGAVAGLVAWTWRAVRGPVVAVLLAVGAGAGAGVTALVGRLFGGGVAGAASQRIVTPPLEVRATGLFAVEAVLALLVYGLLVTVSARDDLGVGDPGVEDDRDADRAAGPLRDAALPPRS